MKDWLAKKLVEERIATARFAWDLYVKFYTAFLTFNLLAMGFAVQWIDQPNRWPVAAIFCLQNLLSSVTAFSMARYSRVTSQELEESIRLLNAQDPNSSLQLPQPLLRSPFPGQLGSWGGTANGVVHLLFIVAWIATLFVATTSHK